MPIWTWTSSIVSLLSRRLPRRMTFRSRYGGRATKPSVACLVRPSVDRDVRPVRRDALRDRSSPPSSVTLGSTRNVSRARAIRLNRPHPFTVARGLRSLRSPLIAVSRVAPIELAASGLHGHRVHVSPGTLHDLDDDVASLLRPGALVAVVGPFRLGALPGAVPVPTPNRGDGLGDTPCTGCRFRRAERRVGDSKRSVARVTRVRRREW